MDRKWTLPRGLVPPPQQHGEQVRYTLSTPVLGDSHVIVRDNLTETDDPIRRAVDDLVRRYDPGGYRLTCPVAGCRWVLDVPRLELDPEPLEGDYVIRAEGVPREDVELVLRTHVDGHAVLTETGATDVPLPPEAALCTCSSEWLASHYPHSLECLDEQP